MNPYEILFFPKADWPDPKRLHDIARLVHPPRPKGASVTDDLGALSLVLLGLIGTLIDRGAITRDELLAHLRRVDELDGAADGKITPDQVRAALGLAAPAFTPPAVAPKPHKRR